MGRLIGADNNFQVNTDLFGSYAKIPTGFSNENHIYKVISLFQSNSYCDIPLGTINTKETLHKEMVDVINVIHCGIDETKVERVALKDCIIIDKQPTVEPVRGEWIEHNGYSECSRCNQTITFIGSHRYEFCHRCGADMRKESDLK